MKNILICGYILIGLISCLLFLGFKGVAYASTALVIFALFFVLINFKSISRLSLTTSGLTVEKVEQKITELKKVEEQITSIYASYLHLVSLDRTAPISGGMTSTDYLNIYNEIKETVPKVKSKAIKNELDKIRKKLIDKLLLSVYFDQSQATLDKKKSEDIEKLKGTISQNIESKKASEAIEPIKRLKESYKNELNQEALSSLTTIETIIQDKIDY
ncbi:hypothetical protein [Lentilactobacillus buchneri]|uniref:hypothetical protein n=1 Tax=Lentilactobacillus buchneri TaxID=1581 RepID=UPI0011F05799|nr:hypothetical protein [Lentilactobacillus buchneri]